MDGDGDGDDPLSHEDCQVAFDLCVSMSRAFLDKGKREQAFRDILAPYLDQAIRMDGSISCYVDYGVDQLRVPVYLQVVKAEVGGNRGDLPGGVRLAGLMMHPVSCVRGASITAAPTT